MTTSDKADRKSLPAPTRAASRGTARARGGRAPTTEQVLAEALARTLGVDQVSVDSHFFDDLGAQLAADGAVLRPRAQGDRPAAGVDEGRLPAPDGRVAGRRRSGSSAAAGGRGGRRSSTAWRGRPARVRSGTSCAARCSCWCSSARVPDVGGARAGAGVDRPRHRMVRRPMAPSGRLVVGGAAFVVLCLLPIVAKWLLIGRWKAAELPRVGPALPPVLAGQAAHPCQPDGPVRRLAALRPVPACAGREDRARTS